MKKHELINAVIKKNAYKTYIERGEKDDSFNKIICDNKVQIDITDTLICTDTYDIVCIDGARNNQEVYKDINTILKSLNHKGTILISSCLPEKEESKNEGWKAFVRLRSERKDIEMSVIDIDKGIAMITFLYQHNNPYLPYTKSLANQLRFKFEGYEKIQYNYSQTYQDIFVLSMLDGEKNGEYLEIGSADPYQLSNTALLEEIGWKGLSLEILPQETAKFKKHRKNPVINCDATMYDFSKLKGEIDYLQVDCEPAAVTYKILTNLPFDKCDFKVITYEHDHYTDKDSEYRQLSRAFLIAKGYIMVVGNIAFDEVSEYEDWYIHPKHIKSEIIEKMLDTSDITQKASNYMLTPAIKVDKDLGWESYSKNKEKWMNIKSISEIVLELGEKNFKKKDKVYKRVQNFLHSGSLGDIIFSLPFIIKKGGGNLYIKNRNQWSATGQQYKALYKLLTSQPYINKVILYDEKYGVKANGAGLGRIDTEKEVSYDPNIEIDFDLDYFRLSPELVKENVLFSYFRVWNESPQDTPFPYILLKEDYKFSLPKLKNRVEIPKGEYNAYHVTHRYRDVEFDWRKHILKYNDKPNYFLGMKVEYEAFISEIGEDTGLIYYGDKVENLFDMAIIIKNSDKFFCNPSVGQTLAIGLYKDYYIAINPDLKMALTGLPIENILNKK